MIKIVAPWYFSPLVWHALQLSAMSVLFAIRCDQREKHLVLGHSRYHFPNVSSVQTCFPLADIQIHRPENVVRGRVRTGYLSTERS